MKIISLSYESTGSSNERLAVERTACVFFFKNPGTGFILPSLVTLMPLLVKENERSFGTQTNNTAPLSVSELHKYNSGSLHL